ncbi:hypothetical protein SLEP1_g44120 [Rubroshorea leprosula]|uniref:Uncharacterized protein n=1 Tax=Rubroshorea leprosula TaxID=152421 RepID=A0AAV5LGB9_9ROSI|nr:hypothetical protein SLEP1_g44120 [Rubroshorea leprosula]
MSSKETVSVVGSEVMPLQYGSMDLESSPSPSSLEKTVEGVRGDEGRRERGYDVDVDIVEEVKQYRSELGTRDNLGHLVENYEISSRVLVRPVGVEERACSAPRDHWMPVYAHYLIARLRFPIPELLVECIEAVELYGSSALSEAKMDKFLGAAGGATIPKKPRKKSRTSTKQVDEGRVGNEVVPSTAAGVEEEEPELQLKRKSREKRGALQKKKKVMEDLFEAKNMTGARRFINATFPEVDKRHAQDEALRYCGASVVKHVLKSASWVNGLAQEFMDSVKECSLLQRQCDQLQKEKEELEKKNKEISSSFDNIVNLYRLPIAIIAFTDCRKKVKAEYPEVDITKITFDEQKEGVEENGESMSVDFRPQIKLRWQHDADGRAVFPPKFDFEFVAMEEEGAEVEEDEVEAGVEGTEVDESQPIPEVEVHPVPSDDEQPPLPDEQQPTQPPLLAE